MGGEPPIFNTLSVLSKNMSTLYLIPTPLDQNIADISDILPPGDIKIIKGITHFIVESTKVAGKFLSLVDRVAADKSFGDKESESLPVMREFSLLNEHTDKNEIEDLLKPLKDGFDMGLLSDAGVPCVGDPGKDAVALAQRWGYRVSPLVGANAFIMALMASGFNGQSFAFNGYLPIKDNARRAALKALETKVKRTSQTQGFIEAPYRNDKILSAILDTLDDSTRLCIACSITCPNEFIKTATVGQWKKARPEINKKPCIFLLGE